MSDNVFLQVTHSEDPTYAEVFVKKDIDKNLICQIFLREGYIVTFENFTITKENQNEK